MGEAKRKREMHVGINARIEAMPGETFERIGKALMRLTSAASPSYGADCVLQAGLARILLSDLGIESEIVVGYAAWRVGPGDSDVVAHAPQGKIPPEELADPRKLLFHAWLQAGDWILDFSLHQLASKAAALDALDGGSTRVDWRSPYLVAHKNRVVSYREVAQAPDCGVFHYARQPILENRVLQGFHLDDRDVGLARLTYANPGAEVVILPDKSYTQLCAGF